MKRTKLTMFEYVCPKCGIFEELHNEDTESIPCPKCKALSPRRKTVVYPFPQHGSWQVK